MKMLWVGSQKKNLVIPLVQAAVERRARVEYVKVHGLAVSIPFPATDIRARAKQLEAVWNDDDKTWRFDPADPDACEEVRALVAEYRLQEKEAEERLRSEHAEAAQRRRADDEATAATARVTRRDRLVAAAGRTATGAEAQLLVVSTRRMNKATARGMTYPLGELVQLPNGRRGIVVDQEVWFTGDEMASSICWHPETHDAAHWDLLHTVAIVEPTPQETAADAAARAEAEDAAEIHRFVDSVFRTGEVTGDWHPISASDEVGAIVCTYGEMGNYSAGTIYLTGDGRVVYQHPGYYDEYIHTERTITDPAMVDRMRTILAQGPRERSAGDQIPYWYKVNVTVGAS
ncbi:MULTISPECIES: hypothetical protein [unclassified Nocardia]|uniref:hypothetical protein n=1 Tax=unclassified Nocardia TaxID=2637762 RepID=UPI001CE45F9B|nr:MULTISPECIES: hypothetical protein [unclassified Nocardia]